MLVLYFNKIASYPMMEYQPAETLTLLHYQQELIIMLQLMQNFSAKNGNPIKCCMLPSRYNNKIHFFNALDSYEKYKHY